MSYDVYSFEETCSKVNRYRGGGWALLNNRKKQLTGLLSSHRAKCSGYFRPPQMSFSYRWMDSATKCVACAINLLCACLNSPVGCSGTCLSTRKDTEPSNRAMCYIPFLLIAMLSNLLHITDVCSRVPLPRCSSQSLFQCSPSTISTSSDGALW